MPRWYSVFETEIGFCGLAWLADEAGDGAPITHFQLPEASDELTRERLARHSAGQPTDQLPEAVAALVARIQRHLRGELQDFRGISLHLSPCGAFAERVYALTMDVLPGATRTYGQLAADMGQPGAARAVGRALGHNPIPLIVPCHRIVAAGGKPGGFSASGGLTTKAKLLAIEGGPAPQLALFTDVP